MMKKPSACEQCILDEARIAALILDNEVLKAQIGLLYNRLCEVEKLMGITYIQTPYEDILCQTPECATLIARFWVINGKKILSPTFGPQINSNPTTLDDKIEQNFICPKCGLGTLRKLIV